jgi:hypothetical protein
VGVYGAITVIIRGPLASNPNPEPFGVFSLLLLLKGMLAAAAETTGAGIAMSLAANDSERAGLGTGAGTSCCGTTRDCRFAPFFAGLLCETCVAGGVGVVGLALAFWGGNCAGIGSKKPGENPLAISYEGGGDPINSSGLGEFQPEALWRCDGRRFSAVALGSAGMVVSLSGLLITLKVPDDCDLPVSSLEEALEGAIGRGGGRAFRAGLRSTLIGGSRPVVKGFFFSPTKADWSKVAEGAFLALLCSFLRR